MAKYKVNDDALSHAKKLVNDGKVDRDTDWSDAAPSTEESNEAIDKRGYDGYGKWFLGLDTDASDETKDRYGFPYGDFDKVNRAAVIHAKQRAAQNDHDDIVDVAGDLLELIDEKTG